ncbi:TonB-dependent receptor [Mitsuaria sp. GD03876]|uniref:TonB-dependent receptor plug domain-containing protein n=1 Tax=Mitsuaria sp. GD03876 TaxID=2975399 RepID=UPI0024494872|nr:TonB-dependent receptor [Mitsuaria sp. GD03876]MDH0864538.1 TonB-dependent receptor [Mitsuaria sp. GD03876]
MTSLRRPALTPLSVALLLGLSTPAWSQTAPPSPPAAPPAKAPAPAPAPQRARPAPPPASKDNADAPTQLDRVEVQGTSRDDDQRRASTASKIIIGRDEIERYGDSTIGEVLKRLPGVTTGGRPGRGGEVRMRGMGGGYTQILVNGERMPPGFSLDELPPEQIERIEVMRAPTAEYGARAIAGTINVVLREALQRRLNEVRLATAFERDHVTPHLSWTRNDKLDDNGGAYNLTVNAMQHKRVDDVDSHSLTQTFDGAGALQRQTLLTNLGQSRDERKSLNLTGRLQLRLDGGDTIAIQPFLMANRGKSSSVFAQSQTPDLPPTDIDRLDYDGVQTDGTSRATMARLNVQWNKRLGEQTRMETRLGAGRMTMTSVAHREEDDSRRTDETFFRRQDDTTKSRDTQWSFNTKLTHQMDNEHSLVAGVEGEGTERKQTRSCQQLYGTDAAWSNCAFLADFGDNVTASTRRFAAYAQDEWSVGKQWGFYAGLRWEGIQTKSTNNQGPVDNSSSVVTPLLHAVYKLDEKSREQIRASLTRSYKSPNLNDVVGRLSISSRYNCKPPDIPCGENRLESPDRLGNPDLKPEMATGVEIGYEKYLSKGGLLSANFFYRRITDLIRSQAVLETVPYAPVQRYVVRPRNIGNAKTYGVELEAKFRLDEYLESALPINVRSNLSLFHSAVDGIPGPDNKLDQQPRYTANLGADYRLRSVPLTLGASLNYTPSTLLQQSAQVLNEIDKKRVIDVSAMWTFSPMVAVRLAASNLVPLTYGNGSITTTPGRIVTGESTGRSFTVWTLRLELKV